MAYDPATRDIVLFGGYAGIGLPGTSSEHYLDDTWTFNGTNWKKLSPATSPPGRAGASMAYDPATRDIVLFGGNQASNTHFLDDTWAFNGTNWKKLAPATSPPGRWSASMAYDAATRQMVLFGGYATGQPFLADTWTFNGTNWKEIAPPTSPPGRLFASMAYDPATRVIVLFGGSDRSNAFLNDTWTFNGSNWSEVFPATRPPALASASMASDPATSDILLFGGVGASSQHDDNDHTWTFNGSNWSEVFPAPSPPGRSSGAMAYDPATRDIVLFGGTNDANAFSGKGNVLLNDTWTWGQT
jgi:hypothetical protein